MFSSLLSGGTSNDAQNRTNASAQTAPAPSDLTSILPTPTLRVELALLFLLSTDAMRQDLLAVFEPPALDASTAACDLVTLDDEAPSAQQVRNQQRQRGERWAARVAQRGRELGTSEMLGLRRAGVTHFDAWRARVLARVCEGLGVRADVVKRARREGVERRAREEEKRKGRDLVSLACEDDVKSQEGESEKGKWFYEGVHTSLVDELGAEKRDMLLNCCLLLLLSLEAYSSYSRTLLCRLAASLHVDQTRLVEHENTVAKGLLLAASQIDTEEYTQKQAASNASSRKFKIGLATVAGAALIGVTGGLAAPLLMAGVGSVFGALGLGAVSGLLGALAGSPVLIAGLFGAYGGKMTGKMVQEMAKDVQDFRFVPLQGPPTDPRDPDNRTSAPATSSSGSTSPLQDHKLRLAIGIPGWLITPSDIYHPASVLASASTEPFALRWEVTALLSLGVSLTSVLKTYIWDVAKYELVRRTLLGTLAAGLWPLGLLKLARVLDNPFHIGRLRADKAGIVLAHALIGRCQGERPVALVGYSLGARVVYSCLLELARQNAFGLVEHAVLLGAPAPSSGDAWTRMRVVVAGRLVNVYSQQDFILGLLYRASSAQLDVAGLQPVSLVHGVENVDAGDVVDGHTKYRYVTGKILQRIGFEDVSPDGVEKEAEELAVFERKQDKKAKQETDAEKEAAAVESKVNDVVQKRGGGPISMSDVDEVDEIQKKAELLRVAEERERQEEEEARHALSLSKHTAMIDGPATTSKEIFPLTTGEVPQVDSKEVVDPAIQITESSSPNVEGIVKILPRIQIEDLESDRESVASEPLGEMAYLEPEPEPDSEPEMEQASFGGPESGFETTRNRT